MKEKAEKLRREGLFNAEEHFYTRSVGAVNKISVKDNKRIYRYYRDFNYKKGELLTMIQWNKVITTIFKNIAEGIIENTSGVYMDKWGYFGILKYPQVPESVYLLDGALKMYEGGVIYRPVFLPIRTDRKLAPWTFNGTFSRKMLNQIYDKVYQNHKYKFSYSPLRAVYGIKRVK